MTARQPTPQEQARLDAIKKQWEQKRRIGEHFGKISNKVAVYSGKGGVGKTTVSVNLATLLALQGSKVGILDADIDCPNVIQAMNVRQGPTYQNGEFIPGEQWGVKVLSMGFFQENPDEAIIFRGPMIHNTITQFLEGTDWDELDYLITDLPPGTSDAPLTIMQTLPLDGFVIVSAPQELAQLDAKRSINMIRKMNMSVLGLVENFSGAMFGTGSSERLSDELGVPFLGSITMRSEYLDMSKPLVLTNDGVRREYEQIIDGIRNKLQANRMAPT